MERELTESNGADGTAGEPSVASALEHLVVGSQRLITKRIDLALLEGQEVLARSVDRAVIIGAGMVLAAVAWFAVAAALILFVVPDASPAVRLAAYGLLNGAVALGLIVVALRRSPMQARPNGNGATQHRAT